MSQKQISIQRNTVFTSSNISRSNRYSSDLRLERFRPLPNGDARPQTRRTDYDGGPVNDGADLHVATPLSRLLRSREWKEKVSRSSHTVDSHKSFVKLYSGFELGLFSCFLGPLKSP